MSSEAVENKEEPRYPLAGPHAHKDLMDEDKTPGSGMLPPVNGEPNEAPTG